MEQTSWILFLKYLDDFEKGKKTAAELAGRTYTNIISKDYQWDAWAVPKGKDGKLDPKDVVPFSSLCPIEFTF